MCGKAIATRKVEEKNVGYLSLIPWRGLMEDGFEFIIKNGGISSEANYPYTAVDGTCDASKEASPAAQIKGYETVPANSEEALQQAVANQPVSVSIDAGGSGFQFYSSGVFTFI